MLLSNRTSESLDVIVGEFFNLNRSFDRAVSWMQNVWSMPQAASIIHHNLAHLFPLMADIVSGFKDEYNVTTVYPETHRDDREYINLLELTETLLKEVQATYDVIKLTYAVAEEDKDFNAMAMLVHLMNIFTIVIGQVITLRDKAEQIPTDYMKYDRYINTWGIDGVDLKNYVDA